MLSCSIKTFVHQSLKIFQTCTHDQIMFFIEKAISRIIAYCKEIFNAFLMWQKSKKWAYLWMQILQKVTQQQLREFVVGSFCFGLVDIFDFLFLIFKEKNNFGVILSEPYCTLAQLKLSEIKPKLLCEFGR